MDYFGARYYDSKYGRWMSVDPLAEKFPGWSPYNYCKNNPLNIVDPDGRDLDYPDPIGDAIHSAEVNFSLAKESFNNFMDEHHSGIAAVLGIGVSALGGPVGVVASAGIGILDAQYSYSQGDDVGGTIGLITTAFTAGLKTGAFGTAAFTLVGNTVANNINGNYNVSGKSKPSFFAAVSTSVKPPVLLAKAKEVKKQDSGKKAKTGKKSIVKKNKEEKQG